VNVAHTTLTSSREDGPVTRVAVAATAPFGADVLQRLAATREVTCLLTRPDAPKGRGRSLAPPPAKVAAERLGIRVVQPERPQEGLDLGAPGAVVVCAYGLLLPDALLEQGLWLNVHPSLLPAWRGAAPVERAILAGDAETGVTIHQTVKELDAGPIATQEAFPIGPEDDAGAVFARAAEVGARLLVDVLDSPNRTFTPQSDIGVTYAGKIEASDRVLDLTRPADELVRRVRALSPHIGARAQLYGRPVTVWRARVGEGGVFEALEVQPDGGRRMDAGDWLRGLR
jgi:methionyl-tRNA formyltransferase